MLGARIINYRKKLGITQEQLAQKLEVTNQAVSKWETDQCCPDTMLLPKLADILGISIDELFGKTPQFKSSTLPWNDDKALHIAVYEGHALVDALRSDLQKFTFHYDGPVKDVYCSINLCCGNVEGSIKADGYVESGDVSGNIHSGSYVECGNIGGNLNAASYVECGHVEGSVNAMSYVECGNVGENVTAASYVECGNVGGKVKQNNS